MPARPAPTRHSALQMLAVARATAVLCALIGRVRRPARHADHSHLLIGCEAERVRWDLTALLNAATRKPNSPSATWLIRLMEWLRQPRDDGAPRPPLRASAPVGQGALDGPAPCSDSQVTRPGAALKHLLGCSTATQHQVRVAEVCAASGPRSTTPRCSPTSALRRAWTCGRAGPRLHTRCCRSHRNHRPRSCSRSVPREGRRVWLRAIDTRR